MLNMEGKIPLWPKLCLWLPLVTGQYFLLVTKSLYPLLMREVCTTEAGVLWKCCKIRDHPPFHFLPSSGRKLELIHILLWFSSTWSAMSHRWVWALFLSLGLGGGARDATIGRHSQLYSYPASFIMELRMTPIWGHRSFWQSRSTLSAWNDYKNDPSSPVFFCSKLGESTGIHHHC